MGTGGSATAGLYNGLALSFKETMSGYFKPGISDPSQGAAAGRADDCRFSYWLGE